MVEEGCAASDGPTTEVGHHADHELCTAVVLHHQQQCMVKWLPNLFAQGVVEPE